MEKHALALRLYMSDPQRNLPDGGPQGDPWVSAAEGTAASSGQFLALQQEAVPTLLQEEVKPLGMPMLHAHREHLRALAYATACKPKSLVAGTIMLEKPDFDCIRFNTELTETESRALGAVAGKGPERVKALLTKSRDHKDPWSAAIDSCHAPRATLRTGMAMGSANAAIATAGSEALKACDFARRTIDEVMQGLVDEGTLAEDDGEVSTMHQVLLSICQIERRLKVIKHGTDFIQEAALASTDASMRGIRTGLEQARTHCTRTVFGLNSGPTRTAESKALEATCLNQPYVPTSLFGGRLPQALQELKQRQHEYTNMDNVVRDLGGGHMPKFDLVTEHQRQPFRGRPGQPRGNGQSRGQSWRKKKGWKNTKDKPAAAGAPWKQRQQQQQQQPKQQQTANTGRGGAAGRRRQRSRRGGSNAGSTGNGADGGTKN